MTTTNVAENDTAIVPTSTQALSALVDSPLPVFTGEQMAKAFVAYQDLQRALDRAMPDQIMDLDGRKFRKKGYWRAVSVAFNLTVEPVTEHRETTGDFGDGRENFGHLVTYRATAPNGRSATGDGSCFAIEKARRFKCPHLKAGSTKYTIHFPHHTCPDFDSEFQWRVLPADATEHNVRSHAHTRAFNRAVSNLCGFGEVSAEEIQRDEPHQPDAATPVGEPTPPATSSVKPPQRTAAPPAGGEPIISEAQARRFYAIAKNAGWDDEDLKKWLKSTYGLDSDRAIPRRQYEDIVSAVQEASGA